MHNRIQWTVFILLLCSAGAGFAQSVYYGVTDRCHYPGYGPGWWHDYDRYPNEYRCTVGVSDQIPPVRKKEELEPVKKYPVDNPLRSRLDQRMTAIESSGFVNTNKVQMEIVPGLAPKN